MFAIGKNPVDSSFFAEVADQRLSDFGVEVSVCAQSDDNGIAKLALLVQGFGDIECLTYLTGNFGIDNSIFI